MNKKVRIISLKILVILLHIQCAGGMKNNSKSAFKASKSFFRKFTSITNNYKHRFHRTLSNQIPRFYKSKSYRNTTINKLNLLTPISLSALCIRGINETDVYIPSYFEHLSDDDIMLINGDDTMLINDDGIMLINRYKLVNVNNCNLSKNYVGIVSYKENDDPIQLNYSFFIPILFKKGFVPN